MKNVQFFTLNLIIGVIYFLYSDFAFCVLPQYELYDKCKHVLSGLQDEIYSQNKVSHKLARHMEFCRTAKQEKLDHSTFENFIDTYAEQLKNQKSGGGGSTDVDVIGIVTVSADGHGGTESHQLTKDEKKQKLRQEKEQILNYFTSNCGDVTFEESLQAEAVLKSKIANSGVTQAWSECMRQNATGFFGYLIPPPVDPEAETNSYKLHITWKSGEGTKITNIWMRYRKAEVGSPYLVEQEEDGYVRTKNICEKEGCLTVGTHPLDIFHKNITRNSSATLCARNEKDASFCHHLFFPKTILDPEIDIDPKKRMFFQIESYCSNSACSHKNEYQIESGKSFTDPLPNFLLESDKLAYGTCTHCHNMKQTRFKFNNCKYQIKGLSQSDGSVSTSPMESAHQARYHNIPNALWEKVRVNMFFLGD